MGPVDFVTTECRHPVTSGTWRVRLCPDSSVVTSHFKNGWKMELEGKLISVPAIWNPRIVSWSQAFCVSFLMNPHRSLLSSQTTLWSQCFALHVMHGADSVCLIPSTQPNTAPSALKCLINAFGWPWLTMKTHRLWAADVSLLLWVIMFAKGF